MATNLAVALRQSGDLDGAEQAYDRALAVLTAALGPGHPDLGPVLSNSAALLFFRGRYRDALVRYRDALAIGEAALPPKHPQLGHAHNNIGETLLELGEVAAAEQHARDAIAIWESALGRDHVLLAHPLTVLGRSLLARGDAKAAIPELARALALRSEPSPDRAVTCFALAEATWATGDHARAHELATQARSEADASKQPAIDAWLSAHHVEK
jgi:tetratricopeptide (TPR) repeat protein